MGEKKITTMVLKVSDLQCERCYNKIKRLLCKYDQIRDQVYDEKQNKVKIVVVCCSPERIRDKLMRNGGKTIESVEIIVPDSKKPSPGGDKPAAAAAGSDSKKPATGGDKPAAAAGADPNKKPAGDKPPEDKAASKEAQAPPKPAKGTDAAPAGAAGAPKPSKDGPPPAKGNDQAAPTKPKDGGGPKPEAAGPVAATAMPPAPDMATMAQPLTMMGAVEGYPTPSYHYQVGAYGGVPQRYDAYNYPTAYGPPPPPAPAVPAFYGNPYPTYSYGPYPTSHPHPPYNNYNYFTEENPSTCSVM